MQKKSSIDALHHILSSIRQFEKKLDKLQDDVSFHGQTLSDLSVMLANLSGTSLYETKVDNVKVVNKTTAIDSLLERSPKTNLKSEKVKPLPPKVGAKSYQGQKYGLKPIKEPSVHNIKKIASPPKKTLGAKRVMRQRKAEAPRKATTLRPKNTSPKKSKSSPRKYDPTEVKSPIFV